MLVFKMKQAFGGESTFVLEQTISAPRVKAPAKLEFSENQRGPARNLDARDNRERIPSSPVASAGENRKNPFRFQLGRAGQCSMVMR